MNRDIPRWADKEDNAVGRARVGKPTQARPVTLGEPFRGGDQNTVKTGKPAGVEGLGVEIDKVDGGVFTRAKSEPEPVGGAQRVGPAKERASIAGCADDGEAEGLADFDRGAGDVVVGEGVVVDSAPRSSPHESTTTPSPTTTSPAPRSKSASPSASPSSAHPAMDA
ncbi:MAG: hypothetical protein ACT4PL_06525, partial [Phycisphaerales bacterium]